MALGRKNHLFAGSDGGAARWAVVASLLTTAKLNGVEPFAYLRAMCSSACPTDTRQAASMNYCPGIGVALLPRLDHVSGMDAYPQSRKDCTPYRSDRYI